MSLDRLLNPRTIAFIGGNAAELAVEQCEALGYKGEIWPVHPTRKTIAGRRTYATVGDLPAPPDAAFIAVNREASVELVQELAAMGAGGAVCYAAGFAETGPEGAALQARLVDHEMPLIGPNCYGIINGKLGAALWPDVQGCERIGDERGAAIITQSGNLALNLTMNTRGLQFTHVISIGNQAGVTIEQCVEHLAADPQVAAIGIHAESIIDPVQFGSAAIAAHRRGTPLVMLKTGRSEVAAGIATSHTAAIAKPDNVYQALFARYGVVTVDSVNQMAAALGFLVTVGPLPGNRMVSLSCSGGEASLVADRATAHDVVFEPFTAEQVTRVGATLSDLVAITNPLDYHTFIWGDQDRLTRCFTAALDGTADTALLVLDWPTAGDPHAWYPTLEAIAAAHEATGTPTVVAATLAENMPAVARERMHKAGIAVAHSIDGALKAVAVAAAAGRWLAGPVPELHGAPRGPHHSVATLSEAEAKEILASSGVTVPRFKRLPAGIVDDDGLRYPLVAKASGIAHKSDAGGVVLNISNEVELAIATDKLATLSNEVLVEEQVPDAVAELLVTVRCEPPIGTVLVIGSGGTMVELVGDAITALLPVAAADVHRMLGELAVGDLLAGHRGSPAANEAAIVDAISKLAKLMTGRPDIVEIEINPLLATPTAALAVDALITIGEETR